VVAQADGGFQHKVVVLTGAGTGIGREMALAFSARGARVAIAARRVALLEETAELCVQQTGHRPLVLEADVTDEGAVDRMIDGTVAHYGALDFAVSNAASPGKDSFIWEQTLENWDQTLATNLTAQMLVARAALRHMMPKRRGAIVLFSSTAAHQVFPRKSHYNASKYAVFALTRTLAKEAGAYGIRANCVVPGATRTELLENYIERIASERGIAAAEVEAELASDAALGRVVTPSEVAEVALFLCSDASSGVTGQAINVCGGSVFE